MNNSNGIYIPCFIVSGIGVYFYYVYTDKNLEKEIPSLGDRVTTLPGAHLLYNRSKHVIFYMKRCLTVSLAIL